MQTEPWRWLLLGVALGAWPCSRALSQEVVERFTLKGHRAGVASLTFSPDGRMLASGSFDRTIRLWEVASGQARAILRGHTDKVLCVRFTSDGRGLASGAGDGTARVWKLDGETCRVLRDSCRWVFAVTFSPDSKVLAVGGGGFSRGQGGSGPHPGRLSLCRVADRKEGRTVKGCSGTVCSAAFSP